MEAEKLKLIMTIEVELSEKCKELLDSVSDPDKAINILIKGSNLLDLGTITKVGDIDFIMHEIVKP